MIIYASKEQAYHGISMSAHQEYDHWVISVRSSHLFFDSPIKYVRVSHWFIVDKFRNIYLPRWMQPIGLV